MKLNSLPPSSLQPFKVPNPSTWRTRFREKKKQRDFRDLEAKLKLPATLNTRKEIARSNNKENDCAVPTITTMIVAYDNYS